MSTKDSWRKSIFGAQIGMSLCRDFTLKGDPIYYISDRPLAGTDFIPIDEIADLLTELNKSEALPCDVEVREAAAALCDAVERYVCPKRGDKTCLRSELLNTKERLREALKR